MYFIDPKAIAPYPRLKAFLEAEGEFDGLLTKEDFNHVYTFAVPGKYDPNKHPRFTAFEVCVMHGLTKQVDYIIAHFDVSLLIRKRNYRTFRLAAENNHIAIFDTLLRLMDDGIENMLSSYNYMIFRITVKNNYIDFVKHLLDIAGDLKQQMLSAHGFQSLDIAIQYKHLQLIKVLLSNPFVFKYASNKKSYQGFIPPFITQSLKEIKQDEALFFNTSDNLQLATDILE